MSAILRAIEMHRAAHEREREAITFSGRLLPSDPKCEAAEQAFYSAAKAEQKARHSLLSKVPRSVDELVTFARYVEQMGTFLVADGTEPEDMEALLRSLANACLSVVDAAGLDGRRLQAEGRRKG